MKKLTIVNEIEKMVTEQENQKEAELLDSFSEFDDTSKETTAGLEAIIELKKLSTSLESKENNNVSLEAYGDFALVIYNNIRNKVGLESELVLTNSSKIKDFIKKIIEAIKRIISKLREFFEKAVNFFKNKIVSDTKKAQQLISYLEIQKISNSDKSEVNNEKVEKAEDVKEISSDEIKFFPNLEKVTYKDVFEEKWGGIYDDYILLKWSEQIFGIILKNGDYSFDELDSDKVDKKIEDINHFWFSKINGSTFNDNNSFSKSISPCGFITLGNYSVRYSSFKDTPGFKPVSKQIVEPIDHGNSEAISVIKHFINNVKNNQSILEKMEKDFSVIIKNTEAVLNNQENLTEDQLDIISKINRYGSTLLKAHVRVNFDLISSSSWYCDKVTGK